MNNLIWSPTQQRIQKTHLYAFMNALSNQYDVRCESYQELQRWSVTHPELFWKALWEYTNIQGELIEPIKQTGQSFMECQWLANSKLNFAQNLLPRKDNQPAILAINEQGLQSTLSWQALYKKVAQVADQLQKWGFSAHDIAAGYLPNCPETVIAMLAVTALGGIWTTISPDFGFESLYERLEQVKPKILFCCTQNFYAGTLHDRRLVIEKIAQKLENLAYIVVLDKDPFPDTDVVSWNLFNKSEATDIDFQRFPAQHPLYILYSSGTTGKPKCIVHQTGGILLQHLKEHQLHCDIQAQDRVFFYTTSGWMMWNWLISALASQATLVLYDGSPMHPSVEILWHYAQQQEWTFFGTSARYLDTLNKQGYHPNKLSDWSHLKTLCSTGSPLSPEGFDFVYQHIKSDIHLASISGGTDLCSCFALGNPISPVYRGQLQGAGLGMDVDVVDENGTSIENTPGELVCKSPFPSQPLGFFADPHQEKYHQAYFARFPDMWCHGDWVRRTPEQGFIFLGRSDATLNPGGVRIGTAEIYRQLEQIENIEDSLAVGQQWQGCERIILFVKLTAKMELDQDIKNAICHRLKTQCSPRHVPAKILQVSDMPRTKSGKLAELAIRRLIHGESITNKNALINPEVLDEFYPRVELET